MDLTDLSGSLSIATTVEATHRDVGAAGIQSSKNECRKPKSFRDRLRERRNSNKQHLNFLTTKIKECEEGLSELHATKKLIEIERHNDIDGLVQGIEHSTVSSLTKMMKLYEEASTRVIVSNGIKE